MAQLKNTNISDTGNLLLPQGTTAQRPASPSAGMIRYNTTIDITEFYDGSAWKPINDSNPEATGGTVVDTTIGGVPYRIHYFTQVGTDTFTVTNSGQVEYLIVAGGGGGGSDRAGGGGAGGVLTGFFNVVSQSYSVSVGGGGAGGPSDQTQGTNGGNSSAFGFTAIGGGGGGHSNGGNPTPGNSGGSGGGGSGTDNASAAGGLGIPGQGNNGGAGDFGPGTAGCSGGGGGAGSPGENGISPRQGGNGGSGILSSITGNNKFYASGGGGGIDQRLALTRGFGGIGGGGDGGDSTDGLNDAQDGLTNTGGGGGGGGRDPTNSNENGGNGGSGIVIIRYPRNSETTTTPDREETSTLPLFTPITESRLDIVRTGLFVELDAANSESYPGEGTVWRDLSGNGYNGNLIGGVNYRIVNEINNGSFLFNNVDGYVDIPSFSATTINDSTIIAWVNDTSSDTNYRAIFQQNVAGDDALYINPSNVLHWWPEPASSLTVPKNQWNFVAVSHSYTSGLLYQVNNNTQFISGTFNNVRDWDFMRLGGHSSGDGERWGGYMSQVFVYNRALNENEIQQIFNATRSRYGI